MKSEYLLTIYMPTYNRAEKAEKQIKFILDECKEYEDIVQIIVSNNCSTDDTEKRIKTIINATNVVYNCNEENLGIRANYYTCRNFVKGEFLWVVSDDDILKIGVVKYILQVIEQHKELNFILLNYGIGTEENFYVPWEGNYGYINDALPELYKGCNGYVIITTTAAIYRYRFFEQTMDLLPVNDISSYGMHFFVGALAIKAGGTFVSKELWIIANDTSGWYDRMIMSYCGMMKMFNKLDEVGFTLEQVHNLYKGYVQRGFFWEIISSNKDIAKKTLTKMITRSPILFLRWSMEYYRHVYSTDVIADKIMKDGKPVYIYCSGIWGKEALQELRKRGIVVNGFFDSDSSKWGTGIEVKEFFGKNRLKEIGVFPCLNFNEIYNDKIQIVIAINNKKEAKKIESMVQKKSIKCVYRYRGFL